MRLTQCPKNVNHVYPILLHEAFFLWNGCYRSPSGVSGGGTRSSGLKTRMQQLGKFKNTIEHVYRGGIRGDISTTLAL